MTNGIHIGNIVVDCKDAAALRDFYAGLLGGVADAIAGHPVLHSPGGLLFLFSQTDVDYTKPVWPEEPGRQQKQMHFDFHVDDLALAITHAEKLGAEKTKVQFGGHHYVTMLDPEGHPFCLCQTE